MHDCCSYDGTKETIYSFVILKGIDKTKILGTKIDKVLFTIIKCNRITNAKVNLETKLMTLPFNIWHNHIYIFSLL